MLFNTLEDLIKTDFLSLLDAILAITENIYL